MASIMHETAFAKINLALHVRGRRPDGYHEIDTLFAFAEDGDRLTVSPADDLSLELTGPFAAGLSADADNLVLRAANALRGTFGVSAGARLALDKRLPPASGIGGGSADAAAALRLLSRWWRLESRPNMVMDLAAGLGADVPACLVSRTARGMGKGDRLVRVDEPLAGTPVLLVNPAIPLATSAVFAGWDGKDGGPLAGWRHGRNDLEPAATALVPEIAQVLAALAGARLARMSGSGATCFGLYDSEDERDAGAAAIAAARPGWWLLPTRLR